MQSDISEHPTDGDEIASSSSASPASGGVYRMSDLKSTVPDMEYH
jgi:hypothetical protein